MKQRLLNLLRSVEAIGLSFFALIILRAIFTKSVDETEFTVNVYFWVSRLIELHACVIAFNCISTKYYKLAIPACAITLMSFINEILHTFQIVELNNVYLLSIEFIILLIILWAISKISYTSY
jgi:hypothetical protein